MTTGELLDFIINNTQEQLQYEDDDDSIEAWEDIIANLKSLRELMERHDLIDADL